MNEKEQAKCLQSDLDRLLAQKTSPANLPTGDEYQQLLDTARQIASNDMSGQSRIRQSLRQRLTRPNAALERWSTQRLSGDHTMKQTLPLRAALIALTLIVAFGLVGAIPSVQAFAQSLLQQIGPVVITDNPTAAEQYAQVGEAADPSASPTPLPAVGNEVQTLSRTEAREQYGFDALEPGYLPQGYEPVDEPQLFRQPSGSMVSHRSYTSDGTDVYLSIQQSTYREEDTQQFAVGDAKVSEVTVRGQKGTWIEQANVMTVGDGKGGNRILPVNYLMWEEDGSFFVIDSSSLGLDEILQIAESLK